MDFEDLGWVTEQEREHVIRLLRTAELDPTELGRRVELARTARTRGELHTQLADQRDLVEQFDAEESPLHLRPTLFNGARVRGEWPVPPEVHLHGRGTVSLDFSTAHFLRPVIRLNLDDYRGGSVYLRVPVDVFVDIGELTRKRFPIRDLTGLAVTRPRRRLVLCGQARNGDLHLAHPGQPWYESD